MAKFTGLMLDDASNTWLDVNLDQATHIQPEESYTTIHFAGGTKIDIREKPSEILNKKLTVRPQNRRAVATDQNIGR